MRIMFLLPVVLVLGGCVSNLGGGLFGNRADRAAEETVTEAVDPAAAEAVEAAGEGRVVGFSVISLGDASVPGLWLETPLVTEEGPGQIIGEDGTIVNLTLRPSGGERNSGSRLSLQGYDALGIPLSALPTVTVVQIVPVDPAAIDAPAELEG